MKWHDLKGHKILAIRHDDDLYLITDKGMYRAMAEGDCCAYASVSSVVNAADILQGTITDIDIKDHKPLDESGDEVTDVTFYTIVTEKGRADVILHVEHNGYYGGILHDPQEVDEIPASALIPEV